VIAASMGPERRMVTLGIDGGGMRLVYTRSMPKPPAHSSTAPALFPGFPAILALLLAVPSGAPAAATAGSATPDSMVETVDVSMVLVPVVVRDASGRPVSDLAEKDFTILEEGEPQPIAAFGRESRPVSIVLALDTSPSMKGQDLGARRAAIDFVRGQVREAAFAVETFNDAVHLEIGFTTDRKAVEETIAALRLGGDNTALFDALTDSAVRLDSVQGGRIAVIFTDGTETLHPQDESERRLAEAVEAATRRDVSVYTVAFGPRAATSVLKTVAEATGGEAFSAGTVKDLSAAFSGIAESVGSRYLLGYRAPSGVSGFRRIEVKIARPDLRVAARRGWFAR